MPRVEGRCVLGRDGDGRRGRGCSAAGTAAAHLVVRQVLGPQAQPLRPWLLIEVGRFRLLLQGLIRVANPQPASHLQAQRGAASCTGPGPPAPCLRRTGWPGCGASSLRPSLQAGPWAPQLAVDDAWRHLRTQRAPPTTLSASPEATTSSAPSFFDMRCCWGCVMGSPVKQGEKLGLKQAVNEMTSEWSSVEAELGLGIRLCTAGPSIMGGAQGAHPHHLAAAAAAGACARQAATATTTTASPAAVTQTGVGTSRSAAVKGARQLRIWKERMMALL